MNYHHHLENRPIPEGIQLRCPFCKKGLRKITFKLLGRGLENRQEIPICPYCHSIISAILPET